LYLRQFVTFFCFYVLWGFGMSTFPDLAFIAPDRVAVAVRLPRAAPRHGQPLRGHAPHFGVHLLEALVQGKVNHTVPQQACVVGTNTVARRPWVM
jgi:hypothetical protein